MYKTYVNCVSINYDLSEELICCFGSPKPRFSERVLCHVHAHVKASPWILVAYQQHLYVFFSKKKKEENVFAYIAHIHITRVEFSRNPWLNKPTCNYLGK